MSCIYQIQRHCGKYTFSTVLRNNCLIIFSPTTRLSSSALSTVKSLRARKRNQKLMPPRSWQSGVQWSILLKRCHSTTGRCNIPVGVRKWFLCLAFVLQSATLYLKSTTNFTATLWYDKEKGTPFNLFSMGFEDLKW